MQKIYSSVIGCVLFGLLSTPLIANQEISKAKTLKMAIGAEPVEGFDPMLGWSHGSYLLLHSPLLQQKADLSWNDFLTDSVKLSPDALKWTINLKKDLKFSDGSPLTADDVVFTYNQAAANGGKVNMGSFKDAKKINDQVLEISLSAPQSTFVNVLGSLGIVPAAKYNAKTFAKAPIGAGPYRLLSFQPGNQLVVEANPWYAGKKNDFERLVFVFLDEDNAYAAAQSGQLDLVRVAPSLAVQPTKKNLKLWVRDSVENRGISFPMVPSGTKNAAGYPVGNDVTADKSIRQAINYAINRKQLAEQVMEGYAMPAYSAAQGLPWQNPAIAIKDGDLKQAQKILEDGGWQLAQDGVRTKNGMQAQFSLWYPSGDSGRRDLAEAVRAMLQPLGIKVQLQSGSWETIERHMHASPTLFGWGSLDPMELYYLYSGKVKGVEFYNPGYYSNARVDRHLQNAINSKSWQAAVPYWQQVEWDGEQGAGIQGDAAWAWLLNLKHTYVANACIDLGESAPEIHGSWSLLNNLSDWKWHCK